MSDSCKELCSHSEDCALYGLFLSEGALSIWKTLFCLGRYERCVRYTNAQEGKPSPDNLLPNGKLLDGGIS